jgi:hypothetical protein
VSLIPVTLTNATDTWVNQPRPTINYSDGALLRMRAGSPNQMFAYIYFSRPFPLGATITSAVLHIRQNAALTGSRTVTARRTLQSWKVARLDYSTQPSVDTAAAASVTKTGGAAGSSWDLDITATMQAVSDGQAWYGLRLETTDTAEVRFNSSQASGYKPTLDVTWTDAPEAPSTLAPAGGRAVSAARPILRFDFTDFVGNTSLNAVRVQTNDTNVWTAPAFDSSPVLTSTPQLDLLQTFPRTAVVNTTSASTTITSSGQFRPTTDIGTTITGTNIPAGATITAVASTNTATISAAATATATGTTATITDQFAAMTDGQVVYWRVQVQDGAGVWSPWSLAAQFTRQSDATLAITNPPSASAVVQESTPPITWTLTGRTQAAFQVIITDATGRWLHTSGKLTSTATSYTIPSKIINDGQTYTAIVRSWDTLARETTPNDPVYVEASRAFTYTLSTTVAVVTGLTGRDLTPIPGMQLDWTRATAPDSYTVVRDGRVIAANILPGDVLVSGTASRFIDHGADPMVAHTWQVRAVVNGVTSASNPTVVATLRPVGIWITDDARGISVQLLGSEAGTWGVGEEAAVHTPVGGTRVVRVTQALRGFEGSIAGTLVAYGNTPVTTAIANMNVLKQNAGSTYWLTVADMTIPVIIGNVVIAPVRGTEIRRAVTFDFWQVGELPFVAAL